MVLKINYIIISSYVLSCPEHKNQHGEKTLMILILLTTVTKAGDDSDHVVYMPHKGNNLTTHLFHVKNEANKMTDLLFLSFKKNFFPWWEGGCQGRK